MKLRIPESPLTRMAVAIGAAVAVMVVAGLIYLLLPGETAPTKIDGLKFVNAAHAYTRQMVANKQPIPKTVTLTELAARGLLDPADIAPFQGLDAAMVLTYQVSSPLAVVMRVHMPDDTYLLLLSDGSTRTVAR